MTPFIDSSGNPVKALLPPGGAFNRTIANISASFTRPANTTAYPVNALVANSTTAGSVTPLSFVGVTRVAGGSCKIEKCRMYKSGTGVTGAAFRLHLYSVLPASFANGDGGARNHSGAAGYLGAFDFNVSNMVVHTDGVACNGVTTSGYPVTVDLASGTTIYGVAEALAGYNPTSGEGFTFVLEVEQE